MVAGNNGILTKGVDSTIANELGSLKEKVTLALTEKKMLENETFDVNKYTSLESLGITSKYTEFVKLSKGEMYITYDASEQIRRVAQNLEITIAKNKIVENTKELILEDSEEGYIKNYRIYGNSIQNGTPSPDNPVEIQSVGNKTINIVDINQWAQNFNATTYIRIEDNKIYVRGGPLVADSNSNIVKWIKSNLKPSTTYTSYFVVPPGSQFNGQLRVYSSSRTELFRIAIGNGNLSYTFRTPDSSSFDTISYIYFYGGNNDTSYAIDYMIVEGSYTLQTIPKYEPYGKYKIPLTVNDTTTNIYLDEPLRKIGNYIDYIDFKTGKIVRNTGKEIWDSTQEITYRGGTSYHYYIVPNNKKSGRRGLMCSHFIYCDADWSASLARGYMAEYWGSSTVSFNVEQTTVDSFRNWLTEKKPTLLYALKLPTEETIVLPNIILNQGTNNITIGTDITPSKIEIEY